MELLSEGASLVSGRTECSTDWKFCFRLHVCWRWIQTEGHYFKTQQEAEQWYKRNPQWTGGHQWRFQPQHAPGFGQANIETLPMAGECCMFEAQSDWGQRVRKEQEEGKSLRLLIHCWMNPIG